MADTVIDLMLEDYQVPTLKMFAQRKIFDRINEVQPDWPTKIFVENLHLNERIRNLTGQLDKLNSRIRRRKNRIREAIHESQYVSAKMEEICDAIEAGEKHYAITELRCLRDLDTVSRELQYWRNLIQVFG